jgi:hypothetical protein
VGLAVFVLGGSIVLAGSQVFEPNRARTSPDPGSGSDVGGLAVSTPTPRPTTLLLSPTLDPPAGVLRTRRWTATGTVPAPYVGRRGFRIRVFRNGRPAGQQRVGRDARFVIEDVALRRGRNRLTARVVAADGQSLDSTAVLVVVDDVPPRILIRQPPPGVVINAATAHVVGEAEDGARLTIANATGGHTTTAVASEKGRFEADVRLAAGPNDLRIRAVDVAGNTATRNLRITRGEGAAKATLTLSRQRFRVEALPATLSVTVRVLDADGRLVDRAPVTFSISPPGLPTTTYRTVTDHGAASWPDIHLPADGAVTGEGLVTVLVELAEGGVIQGLAEFRFR